MSPHDVFQDPPGVVRDSPIHGDSAAVSGPLTPRRPAEGGAAALYLSLAAFAVSVNAVSPLLSTMARDLGIQAWILGAAVSVQFGAFAVISFSGEGLRRMLGLRFAGMVTAGLGLLGIALAAAPFLPAHAAAFLLWASLLGAAGGCVETYASILLSGSPGGDTFRPLCLSQVFYSAGAFAAPLVARLCLAATGGWRLAFFCFALIAAASCGLLASSTRGLGGRGAHDSPMPVRSTAPDVARPSGIAGKGAWEPRGGRMAAAAFGLLILLYVLVEILCWSWMPFILETCRGLSAPAAASTAGLFWIGMILGRAGALILPARSGPTIVLSLSPLLMLLGSIILPYGQADLALALLGMGAGPFWPLAVKTASDRLMSPGATAIVIGMGGIGAALGPLAGSAMVRAGLGASYFAVLAAGCATLLVLTATILAWTRPSRTASGGGSMEPVDGASGDGESRGGRGGSGGSGA